MRELHDDKAASRGHSGRRKLIGYLLAAVLTGLAAGVIGPFGTYQSMYAGPRYVYWLTIVPLGWGQMVVISYCLRNVLDPDRLPGWSLMLIIAAIGSLPILFEVRWLGEMLVAELGSYTPLWLGYLQVYFVTTIFSLVQWTAIERWPLDIGWHPVDSGEASPDTPQTAAVAPAAQLSRMPEGLDGIVLCLEMEDHYVRVHTNQGSGLVLQRLSDAVRELADHDGQQVHRSWWVARAAVSGHERNGGRCILLLSNGLKVPVSRSYLAALTCPQGLYHILC
jgi:hypothetical protein